MVNKLGPYDMLIIVNFDCTEAGLTSNCDRMLSAIQWCYQILSNGIVRQHRDRHSHVQNGLYSEVAKKIWIFKKFWSKKCFVPKMR